MWCRGRYRRSCQLHMSKHERECRVPPAGAEMQRTQPGTPHARVETKDVRGRAAMRVCTLFGFLGERAGREDRDSKEREFHVGGSSDEDGAKADIYKDCLVICTFVFALLAARFYESANTKMWCCKEALSKRLLIDGCGVLREHISSGSLKARPTSGPGSLKARPTSAPGLRAGY